MSKHEFKEFDKVLVRMDNVSVWTPAFFGRLDTDEKRARYKHVTTGGTCWTQCIPYNETTKHLIGTTDPYVDPEESPVFEFGDVVEHRVTKVRGIFSRNDPEAAEVFWKGSIVTTACDLEDLHLIRKGNFNE